MPVIRTYEFRASEEEFQVIKDLLQRWLLELKAQPEVIDQLPEGLRPGAYEELDLAIETAENICREFGIEQ